MKLLTSLKKPSLDIRQAAKYSIRQNIDIPEKYITRSDKYNSSINKDALKRDVDGIIQYIPFSILLLGFDDHEDSAIEQAEVTDFWHENQSIYSIFLYPSRYVSMIEFIPNGLPVRREATYECESMITLGDYYGHDINVTMKRDTHIRLVTRDFKSKDFRSV